VQNTDSLCLARSLVIAKAFADGNKELYQRLSHRKQAGCYTLQANMAMRLCRKAGIPFQNTGSLYDVRQFQDYLLD